MSDIVWAILELTAATAAVAGICNCLTRNSLISTSLAILITLLLWYWLVARNDAFWPFAAVFVVPIVVIAAIATAVLAYAIRMSNGQLDDEDWLGIQRNYLSGFPSIAGSFSCRGQAFRQWIVSLVACRSRL